MAMKDLGMHASHTLLLWSSPAQPGSDLGPGPVGSFGRGWGHELCVWVSGVFPVLCLGSLGAPVQKLKEDFLSDGMLDAVAHSHGRVVGVGEALVYSLSHEHPGVVHEGTLDDLVVVHFQLLCGLHLCKGHFIAANVEQSNSLRD